MHIFRHYVVGFCCFQRALDFYFLINMEYYKYYVSGVVVYIITFQHIYLLLMMKNELKYYEKDIQKPNQ